MLHKRFDFTQNGGFPFSQDILKRMQESYADLSAVIAALVGGNMVLSGVQCIDDWYWTNGWVVYNGELLPFIAAPQEISSLNDRFSIMDEQISLVFEDGISRPVILSRYATNKSAATASTNIPMENNTDMQPFPKFRPLAQTNFPVWIRHYQAGTSNYWAFKTANNQIRIEGRYIGSEDVASIGGEFIELSNFPFNFTSETYYCTAIFIKNGANYPCVCQLTTNQNQPNRIAVQALFPPSQPETYQINILLSNTFIIF